MADRTHRTQLHYRTLAGLAVCVVGLGLQYAFGWWLGDHVGLSPGFVRAMQTMALVPAIGGGLVFLINLSQIVDLNMRKFVSSYVQDFRQPKSR